VPWVRVRGASVSVAASSSLLPRAAAADAVHPADAWDERLATDGADQLAQQPPAGDGDWSVSRTSERQGTTDSGTGASRSGHGSPDDVIRSPGHPLPLAVHLYNKTSEILKVKG